MQHSKKNALRVVIYVISTSVLAVAAGMMLGLFLKPGAETAVTHEPNYEESLSIVENLMDLLRNSCPRNAFQAFYEKYKTESWMAGAEDIPDSSLSVKEGHYIQEANIVGLIIWAFILGVLVVRNEENENALMSFFGTTNEVLKHAVVWILWSMPLTLFFMAIKYVVHHEMQDLKIIFPLAKLSAVVLFGHAIHGLIVLPLLYFWCVRRNPFAVMKKVCHALITGALVSSSSAALPVTLSCCERKLHIDKKLSRWLVPLMIKNNVNGTVLYEVIAIVFISQRNNIHLELSQIITVCLTVVVTSSGAVGIPSFGGVITLLILIALSLPTDELILLVVMDWLLINFNMVLNIWGNCVGVTLIHHMSQKEPSDQNNK